MAVALSPVASAESSSTMPNLIGKDLQGAQDAIQSLTGGVVWVSEECAPDSASAGPPAWRPTLALRVWAEIRGSLEDIHMLTPWTLGDRLTRYSERY
ncbi:hypothetical protein [Mycobacterium sp. 141]|uniref:hypothetical protein n=1 Tax=Mycobacterium sp. 141 TaxID=1120797 RepID=UPI001E5C0713|nr:hypothetical protein [Mycobacterium sp. 141]